MDLQITAVIRSGNATPGRRVLPQQPDERAQIAENVTRFAGFNFVNKLICTVGSTFWRRPESADEPAVLTDVHANAPALDDINAEGSIFSLTWATRSP